MNKKILGAALGAAALMSGAMVSTAPAASADPLPHAGNWWLAYNTSGADAQTDDTITGTAILEFYTEINFTPTRIECQIPAGLFTYDLQSIDLGPHAANTVVDLDLTPPVGISSSALPNGDGVCQDVTLAPYGSGQDLDVTTDGVTPWTVHVTTPAAPGSGDPHLFDGIMAGSVDIPERAIDFEDPSIGCWAQGPITDGNGTPQNVAGTYDTISGDLIPTFTEESPLEDVDGIGFEADSPDDSCVVDNTYLLEDSLISIFKSSDSTKKLTVEWKP